MSYINFKCFGDKLDFEKLETIFFDTNIHINKKGESRYEKHSNKAIVFEQDSFFSSIKIDDKKTYDKAIYSYINKFINDKDYIKELLKNNDASFVIELYLGNEKLKLELSNKTIKLINEFGLTLWVTVDFLGDFYKNIAKHRKKQIQNKGKWGKTYAFMFSEFRKTLFAKEYSGDINPEKTLKEFTQEFINSNKLKPNGKYRLVLDFNVAYRYFYIKIVPDTISHIAEISSGLNISVDTSEYFLEDNYDYK